MRHGSDAFFPSHNVAAHEAASATSCNRADRSGTGTWIATADKLGVAMCSPGRGISAIEGRRHDDINPQLQSKIFDSLLLHMKAERRGAISRAAPLRGQSPARKPAPAGWPG